MRVLFVVPPINTHIYPLTSVSSQLSARGHSTAWSGYGPSLAHSVHSDEETYPYDLPDHILDETIFSQSIGIDRYRTLFEDYLIPNSDISLRFVSSAVEDYLPDVIVSDQHAYAGAIAAQRFDLPWVTTAITATGATDYLDGFPKLRAWENDLLLDLASRHGVSGPLSTSPNLTIAFTIPAMAGPNPLDAKVEYVGPSFSDRADSAEFDWGWLAGGPTVLVSIGTLNHAIGTRFLTETIEAARDWEGQMIVSGPPGLAAAAPPNVLVQGYLPQIELLKHVDAVVCHGGHNTVMEALGHGVPLVTAPIGDDHTHAAQRLVAEGAGIRIKFRRAKAPKIREALDDVLSDPSYRQAAQRLQGSLMAAGGAERAARLIESVVR
ncbi:MAG: glycosyltransferase [Bacteroidota bacterium]